MNAIEKIHPPKIDIEPENDGWVQMFFRFSSGSILILQGVYNTSFFNQPCGYICMRG